MQRRRVTVQPQGLTWRRTGTALDRERNTCERVPELHRLRKPQAQLLQKLVPLLRQTSCSRHQKTQWLPFLLQICSACGRRRWWWAPPQLQQESPPPPQLQLLLWPSEIDWK